MRDTAIEWATHTFNPWRGCERVSAGCDHCYAETLSKRNPAVLGIWGGHDAGGVRVVAGERQWNAVARWNAAAAAAGKRDTVFCASLADIMEDWPGPMTAADGSIAAKSIREPLERLYRTIDANDALQWLLLTKRPQRYRDHLPATWRYRVPDHVSLGASVEDQPAAAARLDALTKTASLVRWVSAEPLLGPLDLTPWLPRLHWVIAGGESGPRARPCHPDWVRSLRDQCTAAGVPFFFKQWGEWAPSFQARYPAPTDGLRGLPDRHDFDRAKTNEPGNTSWRLGKALAGRRLDGREWSQIPDFPKDTAP